MATCRMEPCQRTDHRLDVTIQAQILDLLMSLKDEYGLSMLFITHDFGVVAQIADKVAVMYAGRLLETGDVYDVFDHPAHPYTAGLLKTRPVIGRAIGEPLLEHRLATKADVNDRIAQILEIRAGARARVTASAQVLRPARACTSAGRMPRRLLTARRRASASSRSTAGTWLTDVSAVFGQGTSRAGRAAPRTG